MATIDSGSGVGRTRVLMSGCSVSAAVAKKKRGKPRRPNHGASLLGAATFDGKPGILVAQSPNGFLLQISHDEVICFRSPAECLDSARLLIGAAHAEGMNVEEALGALEAPVPDSRSPQCPFDADDRVLISADPQFSDEDIDGVTDLLQASPDYWFVDICDRHGRRLLVWRGRLPPKDERFA
jgi:hypothetical protein